MGLGKLPGQDAFETHVFNAQVLTGTVSVLQLASVYSLRYLLEAA